MAGEIIAPTYIVLQNKRKAVLKIPYRDGHGVTGLDKTIKNDDGVLQIAGREDKGFRAILFAGKVYVPENITRREVRTLVLGNKERFGAIDNASRLHEFEGRENGFAQIFSSEMMSLITDGDLMDVAGVAVRATVGEWR